MKDSYDTASVLEVERNHKDWISLRTLDFIKKQRDLKAKKNQIRSERQRNRMRIENAELAVSIITTSLLRIKRESY